MDFDKLGISLEEPLKAIISVCKRIDFIYLAPSNDSEHQTNEMVELDAILDVLLENLKEGLLPKLPETKINGSNQSIRDSIRARSNKIFDLASAKTFDLLHENSYEKAKASLKARFLL